MANSSFLGSTQKVEPAAPDQPYSPIVPGCAESPTAVRTSKPRPKPTPGGRPGRLPTWSAVMKASVCLPMMRLPFSVPPLASAAVKRR